jgi:hypothetical protein
MLSVTVEAVGSAVVILITIGAVAIYLRSDAPKADRQALLHPVREMDRTLLRTSQGAVDRAATLRLARDALASSRIVGGYLWVGTLIAGPLFLMAGVWNVCAPGSSAVNRVAGALTAVGGAVTFYAAVVLLLPRMKAIRERQRDTSV